MIRVVIADDQTLVREGFALLLSRLPDIQILAAVADGREAVQAAAAIQPDVVLMDLRMP
ncbi:MAG: DNA-binding response regulator, partial [Pseudonocardiales bacterium]